MAHKLSSKLLENGTAKHLNGAQLAGGSNPLTPTRKSTLIYPSLDNKETS